MGTFFGIFVLICGIGLAFVGWLLLKDSAMPLEETPSSAKITSKTNFISSFLNKWPFVRKKVKLSEDSLAKILSEHPVIPQAAPMVPKLESPHNLSQDDEKHIEEEIDATIHVHELKEKYERLDRLFKEKASDLEKAQRTLETEIRTKKEFNKVKDLLEKELKDTKDKGRNVQVELISARTEAESSKKRIGQLETKVTKLEKEILDKEKEIAELLKKQAKLVEEAKKASAVLVSHKSTLSVEAPPIENVPVASVEEKPAVTENAPASPAATTDTTSPAAEIVQPKENKEQSVKEEVAQISVSAQNQEPVVENTPKPTEESPSPPEEKESSPPVQVEVPSEKKPEETPSEKASEKKEKVEEENKHEEKRNN